MMTVGERLCVVACAIVMLVAASPDAGRGAAAYPSRAVECIVPTNPGGTWDRTCRLAAAALQEENLISQRITVTYIPGADGAVALADMVTKRRGDAHTIAVFPSALLLAMASGRTPFTYRDVTLLAALTTDHLTVVVRRGSAINSLGTLLGMMRSTPDALVVGGGSTPGGPQHTLFARLAKAAGVDPRRVRYVPFIGTAEGMLALIGGHVPALITPSSAAADQMAAGTIRALAVFSETRLPRLADVPTATEQGVDIVHRTWTGFYGPPEMPAEAARFWERTLVKMAGTRRWATTLESQGWQPFVLAGAPLRRFVDQEATLLEGLLRDSGLTR